MKITSTLVTLLVGVTFAAPTKAEETISCRRDGNQQEMNVCAVHDFKTADAALNEKYKAIMPTLSPGKQRALRQQQRAWVRKRDTLCKSEAKASEGGSMWSLEFYGCLESKTKARTKELVHWQVTLSSGEFIIYASTDHVEIA